MDYRNCCSEIVKMVYLGYHLLKEVENIIYFIVEKINSRLEVLESIPLGGGNGCWSKQDCLS